MKSNRKLSQNSSKGRQTSLLSFLKQPPPPCPARDGVSTPSTQLGPANTLSDFQGHVDVVVATQRMVTPDNATDEQNKQPVANKADHNKNPATLNGDDDLLPRPARSNVESPLRAPKEEMNRREKELIEQHENNDDHSNADGGRTADFDDSSNDHADESSSCENPEHSHNDDGLSDYERLRLRNIARNNARLEALGLTRKNPALSKRRSQEIRTQSAATKRRRVATMSSSATPPITRRITRRSARQRSGTEAENHAASNEEATTASVSRDTNEVEDTLERQETYEVSPLMQYTMVGDASQEETATSNQIQNQVETEMGFEHCSIASLAPRRKRLNPCMGNVYSMQFSGNLITGAGKAGVIAIWDANAEMKSDKEERETNSKGPEVLDPILSWKGHNGRWVAEARWVVQDYSPGNDHAASPSSLQQRLVTAANDGTVCLWDLTQVSTSSGVPKCVLQTGKGLHSSGIFSLDICRPGAQEHLIVTGSKDKTVKLSTLDSETWGWWTSDVHSSKVGDVRWSHTSKSLLGSVGDDGLVVLHDFRTHRIVAKSTLAHVRPHSITFHPTAEYLLMTAGHDRTIKLWDIRRFGAPSSTPVSILEGHVPIQETRCKRIHRPVFYSNDYVLTGGQTSHALSLFHTRFDGENTMSTSLCSRGKLPDECGDAGCIAIHGKRVALSTEYGEILLLDPSGK